MADLVASDVTYTKLSEEGTDSSKVRRRFAVTTAAGDYPTGGIPLDSNAMGYPVILESMIVLEQDAGDALLTYTWDRSAGTIFVVEDNVSTGVPAEHANAAFTSPDQLIIEVIGW